MVTVIFNGQDTNSGIYFNDIENYWLERIAHVELMRLFADNLQKGWAKDQLVASLAVRFEGMRSFLENNTSYTTEINKGQLMEWVLLNHSAWIYDLWAEKAERTYCFCVENTWKKSHYVHVYLFSELFTYAQDRLTFALKERQWKTIIDEFINEPFNGCLFAVSHSSKDEARQLAISQLTSYVLNPVRIRPKNMSAIADRWSKFPSPLNYPDTSVSEDEEQPFIESWLNSL